MWFDVSPSGGIACREESEDAGQRHLSASGKRCVAIREAVLQIVTRRIDLLARGAEDAEVTGKDAKNTGKEQKEIWEKKEKNRCNTCGGYLLQYSMLHRIE